MDSQYNAPPPSYSTTSHAQASASIHFNFYYAFTLPGMLKMGRMVLDLIGFICAMCSPWHGPRVGWFGFVSMTGLLITGILLFLYFFHVVEKFHYFPWLLGEFIFCIVWVVFYLIASSLAVPLTGAMIAAGVFGYLSMIVYGVDAFFKFMAWRSGAAAQGEIQNSAAAPSY